MFKRIGVSGIYYGSFAIDVIIVLWTAAMVKREFILLRKKDSGKSRGKINKSSLSM